MSWAEWLTVGAVALMTGALVATRIAPDLVVLGTLTLLLAAGVVAPEEALRGFANEGLVTVAALFVVAGAMRNTGALDHLVTYALGRQRSLWGAQLRLMLLVAALSTVINNTPLVAIFLPLVVDWSRRNGLSPSKLLMPLSFATILGGLCTVLGTSTNLIVAGLWNRDFPDRPMTLTTITWIGLPCCLVGLVYLAFLSRRWLPDRNAPRTQLDNPREYTVEMVVEPHSPIVGKTIEQAGLRHLPGLFLIEIDRNGTVLPAVAPQEKLHADDRLIFAGIVESVVDLQRIPGLKPATDQVFKLDAPRSHRCLIEAVVSSSCPVVGRTIRDGRFRNRYQAVVLAVSRQGQRLRQKVGDIVLQPGDTLLLEAHPWFVEQYRYAHDFLLLSQVADSTPPRHDKRWLALAIFVGMVGIVASGFVGTAPAAMLAAALLILGRCIAGDEARKAVEWPIVLVIGGSIGIGSAVESTGLAQRCAALTTGLTGHDPWLALTVIYAATMLLTELLSNNAAAILMYPIAVATANHFGASPLPFVLALTIAASCGFAFPMGYQTHLMVYGPGGYQVRDFLRLGGPLNLIVGATTCILVPLVFPLFP
ncbi:MAG: SLC13 family permease [Gemmataceae bacterium]